MYRIERLKYVGQDEWKVTPVVVLLTPMPVELAVRIPA